MSVNYKQVTVNVTPDSGLEFLVSIFVPANLSDNSDGEREYINNWLDEFVPRAREWQR